GLLIVRRRVGEVVVLVGLPGIGNLALQTAGDGVIGARILGFDVGGADDHLGAKGLQGVHFFLGLLVGGGEDALVALDDGGDGQAHAGIAAGALDDGASRLELP